jgi:hypothetical protein
MRHRLHALRRADREVSDATFALLDQREHRIDHTEIKGAAREIVQAFVGGTIGNVDRLDPGRELVELAHDLAGDV